MRFKPNSTVATIIEHDGKLLFVEEIDNNKPVYNQPAGHLEINESLVEAAKREVLEETGHTCNITHYMGLYTFTAPSNQTTYHRHCFIGTSTSYDPNHKLDEGIIGIKWLTIEELIASKCARSPLVIKCAQDYLNGKRYPLNLIYEHAND
ncbi:NUDIX hydrolase [Bermanella sp. WJH001]|uniref:NUDIX hydrolase n=1 Tax=Bermanella sp. WJH001 TaxID=3048005 RepID=UPI0024BE0E6E|nr:NUDIX hydrolase [Bermanella sp. WJH001]MDJ1537003.1 NUDIX hydrolase [Bermanella sp. WJH001]